MKRTLCAAAIVLSAAVCTPAAAADFWLFNASPTGSQVLTINGGKTFSAMQTGWFDSNGSHSPANYSYLTGSVLTLWSGATEYRSFFSFTPSGTATSASITIGNALSGGYYNAGGPLELTLYDVDSSIVSLTRYTGRKDIFDDLGTGTVYGKIRIDGAASSYTIELNQAAVDAINLAATGPRPFTVGARLTALPSVPSGVPEPAAWALMLGGFGLMGGALRARRRRTTVRYV